MRVIPIPLATWTLNQGLLSLRWEEDWRFTTSSLSKPLWSTRATIIFLDHKAEGYVSNSEQRGAPDSREPSYKSRLGRRRPGDKDRS